MTLNHEYILSGVETSASAPWKLKIEYNICFISIPKY